MALSHSPRIVTDGLIFAYDMANTQKSWRGEPTTNLVSAPKNILTGFATIIPTILNDQILNFDNTFTGGLLSGTGWLAYTAAITANGNRYCASWYLKAGSNVTVTLTWGGAHQGNNTTFTVNLLTGSVSSLSLAAGENYGVDFIKDGWWRLWYTSTLTSGNSFFPQINNGSGIMYIGGLQIEAKSYPTPFVVGTRSNTQAILDLIGNNTITASSLTYNSNGTFSFNGSSDGLTCGNSPILNVGNNITINSWFYVGSTTSYQPIAAKHTSSGTLGWEFANSSGSFRATLRPSATLIDVSAGTLIAGNMYMGTVTFDQSTLRLYLNGVQTGFSTTGGPVTLNSSETLLIGSRLIGSDRFNGRIEQVSIYNRALSAAEVQQNFNALRGRYGI